MIALRLIDRKEALERVKERQTVFGVVIDPCHDVVDYVALLDGDMGKAFLERFPEDVFNDDDECVRFVSDMIDDDHGRRNVEVPVGEYYVTACDFHRFVKPEAFYKKYCRTQKAFDNEMRNNKKFMRFWTYC